MSNHFRRNGRFENLEQRRLMAADLTVMAVMPAAPAGAETEWFIADSFSFGIEREMKESVVRPSMTNTETPSTQAMIFVKIPAIGDNSIRSHVEEPLSPSDVSLVGGEPLPSGNFQSVDGLGNEADITSNSKPVCYLKYKLDRCFVKSWSTSGDADDRPTQTIDLAFAELEEAAMNSHSLGLAEFNYVGVDRPTEEVAFYYNKIAFNYAKTSDGNEW